MCGTNEKPCGICVNAKGGCLASMRDDFFSLASKEKVKRRLNAGEYIVDKETMIKYITNKI